MASNINTNAYVIADNFSSMLQGLEPNERFIDELSMFAIMHAKEYASVISDVIMKFTQKISYDKQLPLLYLMNSIIKNAHNPYFDLFEPFICDTFLRVLAISRDLDRVDELKTLRKSWDHLFPEHLLMALDEAIHKVENDNEHYRIRYNAFNREVLELRNDINSLRRRTIDSVKACIADTMENLKKEKIEERDYPPEPAQHKMRQNKLKNGDETESYSSEKE